MTRLRARLAIVLVLVAVSGAAALAQRFGRRFGGVVEGAGAGIRVPPKDFSDGGFTICKWMFRSNRPEAGGIGWSTDYPFGEINLLTRLAELTKIRVSRDRGADLNYWVVQLTDDQLFECPIVIGSDVGTAALSTQEVERLRQYLLKGGFLWVDDFWGTPAWTQWSGEIHKALPEYRIFDIPSEHPIRHMLFPVHEVAQITNIANWLRTGNTSERGDDSPHANFRGIADEHGRLMVVMTHNTDMGDSWEREGENHEFFERFSPKGYALGVNVLLYSMTH